MKNKFKTIPNFGVKFINAGKLATIKKKKSPITKICPACLFSFSTTDFGRVTCSRDCLKRHLSFVNIDKIGSGFGKSGTYKQIKCQSTYELAFLIWALEHKKEIKRCGLRIPYTFENKDRFYTPDFELEGKIIEIKGYETPIVIEKLKSAKKQGLDITVIDSNKIQRYIKYVNTKYRVNIEKEYAKFYQT